MDAEHDTTRPDRRAEREPPDDSGDMLRARAGDRRGEETQEPEKIFPRIMLTGLGIAVVFYVLVAVSVIAVIPEGEIESVVADEGKVLLAVVQTGAPGIPIDKIFPFLTVIAVANTALLNMLMASRLLYGLAHQDVLPRTLGKVLPGRRTPYAGIAFSTVLALGLIVVVTFLADTSVIGALSGTTALLLLCVFTVVNVACIVLRRDTSTRRGFSAPGWVPFVGAVACAYLAGPWARDREDWIQYQVAGGLRHLVAEALEGPRARDEHGGGHVAAPALGLQQPSDRARVERVGRHAVHGVGGDDREQPALQRVGGLGDAGLEVGAAVVARAHLGTHLAVR